MYSIEIIGGRRFTGKPGETLLDAAFQAKIALPYSCKLGRCSVCKCKVLNGRTQVVQTETGLSEHEKAEGWILSCVRSAESDVMLEVENLNGIIMPTPKTWPCRINEVSRLATDVVRVLLRLPPTTDFHFIPGQYIDVIGPNGVHRSYSLANAGFTDKVLELHIRAVQGGVMSDYWFNRAKPNDLLRLVGPFGTFFLREIQGIDLIFLATGTGIAPVNCMLESLLLVHPDQQPRSVSVLWGGRKVGDLYMNLADIPGTKTYIPVLSRPSDDWSGARGYVQDVLLDSRPNLTNAAVYACGSDAMIHSAKMRLVEAGLPVKRFYFDAFVSTGAS